MKQINFTLAELKILKMILDHTCSIPEEEIQREIKSDYGFFNIKSIKQANNLMDKLDIEILLKSGGA